MNASAVMLLGDHMPGRLVRCSHCGEVVEAEPGICSACGGPLRLLPAAQPETTRSFAEKYRGSEFDSTVPSPVVKHESVNQEGAILMIGLGIALVLVVVVVGAMVLAGGSHTPSVTAPPVIAGRTPTPSPHPLSSLVLEEAYSYISSPDVEMKLSVTTVMAVDARVAGSRQTTNISATASLSGGKLKGHVSGPSTYDFSCLAGGWGTSPNSGTSSCRIDILPLFGITKIDQLQYVGTDKENGIYLYHLVTTNRWGGNPGHIALVEAALPLNPTEPRVDLWVSMAGQPVKAELTANYDAPDGTRLLALSSKYAFTEIGFPAPTRSPA